MTTYPDSATLASFRRSIDPRCGMPVSPPPDRPRRYDATATVIHTLVGSAPVSGAWSDELQHGIGYRAGHRGNLIWSQRDPATDARNGASAMRSRAYARSQYVAARALPDCGSTYAERQVAWSGLRAAGISREFESV